MVAQISDKRLVIIPESEMTAKRENTKLLDKSNAVHVGTIGGQALTLALPCPSLDIESNQILPNKFADLYCYCFDSLPEAGYHEKTIMYQTKVISLLPDYRRKKPGSVGKLGHSHCTLFELLEQIEGLNMTIKYRSSDGAHVVSSSDDAAMRIRDAQSGRAVAGLCSGQADSIRSVAFSPDGHRVVSGSTDKNLRIWDSQNGRAVAVPCKGQAYSIRSVAFSPDGTRVVSGSDDNTIRMWDAQAPPSFDGQDGKTTTAYNLGNSHHIRFKHPHQTTDLELSIDYHVQTGLSTANGHPGKPGMPDNMVISLQRRFECLGDLTDLNLALKCRIQTIILILAGEPDKPIWIKTIEMLYKKQADCPGHVPEPRLVTECRILVISSTCNGYGIQSGWEKQTNTICHDRLGNLGNYSNLYIFQTAFYGHPGNLGIPGNLGVFLRRKLKRIEASLGLEVATHIYIQMALFEDHGQIDGLMLLTDLGRSYYTQLAQLDKISDLDATIICYRQPVLLAPDNYPDKPNRLNSLGSFHQIRFQRPGELSDIEIAIEYHRLEVVLTPDGQPDRLNRLIDLGNFLQSRFQRLGKLSDIEGAIECHHQAVSLVPEGHPDKPNQLNNLGSSYISRFERFGNLSDLHIAMECLHQAIELTPDGHENKPMWLNNTGSAHQRRFERLGELSDLDAAIGYHNQAVLLGTDSHKDRSGLLNNLGSSYHTRFERLGDLADLAIAIDHQTHAVALTPDRHPNKPGMLNNLGVYYKSRFQRLGELSDLDIAIECHHQAVLLTPDGHPDKSRWLSSLAGSHQSHFERLGELSDLDVAIECHMQAVTLTPDGHPDKPKRLNNLGNSHKSRFEHCGELSDLEVAIEYHMQAVALTPDGHPDKPKRQNNLGNSYQSRFQRFGELSDLDIAIEYHRQATALTPDGHPDKPNRLNNLGNSYQNRFEYLGELLDIDIAIEYRYQAIALTPDGHPNKLMWLNNLGSSHQRRFGWLGEISDLQTAIELQLQSILLIPDGHPNKAGMLNNLATSYKGRFECLGEFADISRSIRLFKHAAQSSTGQPSLRFKASLMWARLSHQHEVSSLLGAYQQSMELIPQIIWLGSSIHRRYADISSVRGIVAEAAAAAIHLQRCDLALEWLEEGRSIVWKQILRLRTPIQDLSNVHASLAERLKLIAQALDRTTLTEPIGSGALISGSSMELAAQQHRRLAKEWERLVDQVRQLPTMNNFLSPKKVSDLLAATHSGDIAYAPLPDFSHQHALAAYDRLLGSLAGKVSTIRGFRAGLNKETDTFEEVLTLLWNAVAKPVLDFLGYTHALPANELPHITWCTTGLLSFLPLHAAGDYSKPHSALFDYAISSYTPTLEALLPSPSAPTAFSGIVAVGSAHLVGSPNLPGTVFEIDSIESKAQNVRFTRLEGSSATLSAVLSAMEEHSWVHLACHASQNPTEPTKSAFQLNDGPLDLATITRKPLKHAGLAFLSACQTATGDSTLPDESVHLAAGMLMAGYSTVIATMWSIRDEDAPVITEMFYGDMLEGGIPDSKKAARALHAAVARLRTQVGVKEFERWVPYIHIGK